jgi:putative ABC transport system permease protein
MSSMLTLAGKSLANRRGTALLTIAAIAVSVALLLGVQKLRSAARESFTSTVAGVDLVVGARSGPLNLLLYSVFRIGDPTTNVSWETYQRIAAHRDVAWTIPISLGDSFQGFRVLGTDQNYFEHYRIVGGRPLELDAGARFAERYDAVLGADVAESLRLGLGAPLVLAHGAADVSFAKHDDQPFKVVGILARTGTPVDRTVHISLEAMTALHTDAAHESDDDHAQPTALTPAGLTAFMIGMKDRAFILIMHRALNDYRQEPLTAILPAVALKQLWDLVGVADRALFAVAAFVVLAGLLGMLTAILVSLNERRREMAILRAVGAGPRQVFTLLVAEAGLLASAGVALGVGATYALIAAAGSWLEARYGIYVSLAGLTSYDLAILGGVIGAALIMGLIPAWRAYRNTLADGLTIRI